MLAFGFTDLLCTLVLNNQVKITYRIEFRLEHEDCS